MRKMSALLAASGLLACATVAADDDRMVGFGPGQEIPVTLTLHPTEGEPPGRRTPIFSKYRPKVSFAGGPEMVCSVAIPREVRTVAPGQTAEVDLSCQQPVTVRQAAMGFVVREGGREVGVGQVRLPPAP